MKKLEGLLNNMVIGNGQIAKFFNDFKNNQDILIFASGVSNSNCTNLKEFKREEDLLIDALTNHREKKFVYFSSCALSSNEYLKNEYYLHKERMENIIKKSSENYYIFRLPQVFSELKNHNTLINFLYFSILNGNSFNLYNNAYRYVIDLEDIKILIKSILNNYDFSIVMDLANPYRYSVIEIVNFIESLVNRKGNYNIIDKYDGYELNLKELIHYIEQEKLPINFSSNYLFEKLIKKI